ncbi:alpha/beta fold hydrolase [Leptothermofonsia sichuanensis E412]|uniref:alpha/beta fold hydrolase n=1 Tax=Leptothermofonsia sichuanensis TaxID=2917832 RepID=UPI001CA6AED5|nr:alpha/beta fold hydrolase [Leptothermofonsia sichuanensis]QZZ22626.1 alpha/beta fold hydrolase [Leptothermofonsia sichuanensis E412]
MSSTTENWVEAKSLRWFYREAAPIGITDRLPVLLLHGIPSQSYGWREVLPALAKHGFRAIAPDWIGSGFSAKPDRRDFPYTPESLIEALEAFLETLEIQQFSMVVQGFLGSVGLQYALRHPEQIERIAILNAPITTRSKLPWKIKQLGLPLVGDMMTQDPLLVDRTLEGGGGYRVDDQDLDVYRRPFLKSSDAGRALLATIRSLNLEQSTAEIESGLRQWRRPVLIAWGDRDPWLPLNIAQEFAQSLPEAEFIKLEEVGHYPQEDWHEKVSDALLSFLRRQLR